MIKVGTRTRSSSLLESSPFQKPQQSDNEKAAVLGFNGIGKKKPGGGGDAGGGKQACHLSCPFIFEKRDGVTHVPA